MLRDTGLVLRLTLADGPYLTIKTRLSPCDLTSLEKLSQSRAISPMDMADIAQATSKDKSNFEAASQTDSTKTGSRPTFIGRTHRCAFGIWGLLVLALTIF